MLPEDALGYTEDGYGSNYPILRALLEDVNDLLGTEKEKKKGADSDGTDKSAEGPPAEKEAGGGDQPAQGVDPVA
jgi:hypothetical protein